MLLEFLDGDGFGHAGYAREGLDCVLTRSCHERNRSLAADCGALELACAFSFLFTEGRDIRWKNEERGGKRLCVYI